MKVMTVILTEIQCENLFFLDQSEYVILHVVLSFKGGVGKSTVYDTDSRSLHSKEKKVS